MGRITKTHRNSHCYYGNGEFLQTNKYTLMHGCRKMKLSYH